MPGNKINDSISTLFNENLMVSSQSNVFITEKGFIPGDSSINIQYLNSSYETSYIGLFLLSMMLVISAILYFSPDTIKSNIRALVNNPLKRSWESGINTSGIIINALLYINFIFVFSVSIFFIFKSLLPDYFILSFNNKSIYVILIFVLAYIIFRQIFVWLTGWLFDNLEMSKAHNKLLNSLEKSVGLIILPILLLSIFSDLSWLLALSSLILLVFIVARWVFAMALGLRITKFSWFHIILYLCTLEIIPFLMIIKHLKNQFFQV